MNDSERGSRSDRSPQARFLGGVFSWGCLRFFLIPVASAVGLVVLFYAEEDLRGYYQWNNYRRQIEAHGEQLDLKALIPKPVPDDRSFCATPLVASWFNRENPPFAGASFSDDDYSAASVRVAASERDKGDRHFMDLGAW